MVVTVFHSFFEDRVYDDRAAIVKMGLHNNYDAKK
jgi:hypothetical protein